MRYQAILFDLDGTLLPMDQAHFTKSYFRELSHVLEPLGISPERLIPAVWAGTRDMVCNDGRRTNESVFWARFCAETHERLAVFKPACDKFYSREFHRCKLYTRENPLARQAVQLARACADHVVLATNPLFPLAGQLTRMSWVGLEAKDFDLITSYESDSFCKPNPLYYQSICERLGVMPRQCLMIGNDENEDMYAASRVGMHAYLIRDCLLPSQEHPWTGPGGSFADLCQLLQEQAEQQS